MTRKSKREIEEQLADLEDGPPGEYPELDNLALFLSQDWEEVDEEHNLVRRQDNGEVYHFPQEFRDVLLEQLPDDE